MYISAISSFLLSNTKLLDPSTCYTGYNTKLA